MNLKEFVNPSKKYRPTPIWSWNNVMDASEIETRVREMKRKGFGGFFIRAGEGLRTHYMEDDWMRAIRRAVETARESEMECWLSDDDRGPSGYAGGKTSENADAYIASALAWYDDASSADAAVIDKAVAYSRRGTDGTLEILTEKPDSLEGIGVFASVRLAPSNPRFNGGQYPDLLNEDVTKEFLENTHERYAKLFRYDFGEFMPGIFTCEPTVRRSQDFPGGGDLPSQVFPWSPGFVDFFNSTFGYSPVDKLHHLLNSGDEGFAFRYDYLQAINEYFLLSFTIPVSTWCREHDFKFTGRMYGESDMRAMIEAGGPVISHYEYMDMPGIEHDGRSPGDIAAAKQIAGVAHQLGRDRSLAVLFGGAGYDATFEDMKRIADRHTALGINHIAPRSMLFSLKGSRKRDYPPALTYHQPYWENIRVINDYIARISWAASVGKSAAKVLLLAPSGTACGICDTSAPDGGEALQRMQETFRAVADGLAAEHVSFDIGDERILKRHGAANGGVLDVGAASYTTVVLPPAVTWRSTTLDILEEFSGTVIVSGDAPTRVDGVIDSRASAFAERSAVTRTSGDPAETVSAVVKAAGRDVTVRDAEGSEARSVMVNHRIDAGAHMIFLANTGTEHAVEATVSVAALGGVVELDALTGRAFRYASSFKDGVTTIETTVYPSGSRIFLIDQTQTSVDLESAESTESTLIIEGPYSFTRNQDNTLTLDRCTLEINGRTVLEKAPVGSVKRAIWEHTGIDEYDGYQPWALEKLNVRTRTNRTVLTFEFEVTDVPETLSLAMESADKFTVKINGTAVEPTPGKWHLDKKIPVLDIGDHVVVGTNRITAETDYLWDTEIEPVYAFGDFALGAEADGFPIVKEPALLDSGSWTAQGYPFYAGTMTYTMEFDLSFDETDFFELDLSGAEGANCFVTVNGTDIGSLPFHPFRAEITAALEQGKNTIEVEVSGTLRNALGPFGYSLGSEPDVISPETFDGGSTESGRHFVPYGFVEPPVLVKVTEGVNAEGADIEGYTRIEASAEEQPADTTETEK